ncbi:Retrovirus-related Pol polyprotein from transposon TNT 1-94, partial [Linum grandiflorum]
MTILGGVWVYLMKYKSESRDLLKSFCQMTKTQFDKGVKVIRSDQGKEFHMSEFYKDQGIIHQMSCVQTPEQNARVERKHQHILNVARALKFQSGLPLAYWSDCILHVVYLINRMPTPLLDNQSPYEKIFKSSPSLSHLKVFGCLCYASTLSHQRTKFQTRARQCLFLGIPTNIKGYKLMEIETKQIFISRDVVFYESILPFKTSQSQYQTTPNLDDNTVEIPIAPPNTDIPTDQAPQNYGSDVSNLNLSLSSSPSHLQDILSDDDEEEEIEGNDDTDVINDPLEVQQSASEHDLRRSTRFRRPPTHLQDYHLNNTSARHPLAAVLSYENLSTQFKRYALNSITQREPNTYEEPRQILCWVNAMNEEPAALESNQTWEIVAIPTGKKAIGCKWVYKVKLRSDGSIERHKARLVAKGFTQVYGIDFLDTFSPVAKINSVKTLLAVSAAKNWHLEQMDVSNAFLHGDLDEEVYMQAPPGLVVPPGMCCKLKKSLYGLKQASRQWFAKLRSSLLSHGFRQSSSDYSLFIKDTNQGIVVLLVYVDDIILAGDNMNDIEVVKEYLKSVFKIKDLGPLKYFLGLEVARSKQGIAVNQRKYCVELLAEAGFLEAKESKTPMDMNLKLKAKQGKPLENPGSYRQLVGKLHYLTITRPDIA